MPSRILLAEILDTVSLDALSKITAQDVYHAAQTWRQDAPERHKALLDAIAVNQQSENGAS